MATIADSFALVLTGGDARAAYQVGVLRCLAKHLPTDSFDIITGVSAGAIHAARSAPLPGVVEEGCGVRPAGAADWRGDYLAVWRKTTTSAGLPSWTIAAEVFVALDCTGAGCASR